jgi:hypothetical protein
MSNRIKGFYVALEKDIKDEDFEYVKNAVLMIKGVHSIKENIADSDDWINRQQIKQELLKKIFDIFKD